MKSIHNKPRRVHEDREVADRGQFIVLNSLERLLLLHIIPLCIN